MRDLIDRQAAIEELKSYIVDPETAISENPDDVFQYNAGIRTAVGVIMELPAASPWHRVEEPPKEHMWCFVYTDEPDMIMPIRIAFYVASCTGKGSWYHYESGEDIDDEVDYWTPMYLEGPDVDKDLSWPIEPPKEDA